MHEVCSPAILIAALADENVVGVRRRRDTLARVSPLRCMARVLGCLLIAAASAWVCFLAEGPPDFIGRGSRGGAQLQMSRSQAPAPRAGGGYACARRQ